MCFPMSNVGNPQAEFRCDCSLLSAVAKGPPVCGWRQCRQSRAGAEGGPWLSLQWLTGLWAFHQTSIDTIFSFLHLISFLLLKLFLLSLFNYIISTLKPATLWYITIMAQMSNSLCSWKSFHHPHLPLVGIEFPIP